MKSLFNYLLIWVLFVHPLWWIVFAQEEAEALDMSCNDVTPACNQSPEHLTVYLDVMDKILLLIDAEADKTVVEPSGTSSQQALGQKANTSSFLNEVGNTLFSYDGVFDDYRFLNTASVTLKRDKRKIQDMYFRILDIQKLLNKEMTKKTIPKTLYDSIDAQLQKLEYIKLWKWTETYNMERSSQTYATLIKLLSRINQAYAELFELKFISNQFEDLGTEKFKSYIFPWDQSEKDIDDEKLKKIFERTTRYVYNMYVNPFDVLRKDRNNSTEFVDIDYSKFILMVRELENAYRCTHGTQNVCSDWTLGLRENFKELNEKTLQRDLRTSWQLIKEKTQQLKWIFSSPDSADRDAYKQRKEALKQSRYWASGRPNERWFVQTLLVTWKQFLDWTKANIIDPVVDIAKTTGSAAKNFGWLFAKNSNADVPSSSQWTLDANHEAANRFGSKEAKESVLEKIEEEREQKNKLNQWTENLTLTNDLQQNQYRVLDSKIKNIHSVFEKFTVDKQKERVNDMIYQDTKWITKQAVTLSLYVHAAANRFGDYDKDSQSTAKTINETLTKMCEAQCTNLSDKKCREDQ